MCGEQTLELSEIYFVILLCQELSLHSDESPGWHPDWSSLRAGPGRIKQCTHVYAATYLLMLNARCRRKPHVKWTVGRFGENPTLLYSLE